MQDMATPCQHPRLGHHERWRSATKRQQYATRHNPFMYFRSITSRPSYCKTHVKPLKALAVDLKHRSTHPLAELHHARTCATTRTTHAAPTAGPGGLRAANHWFKTWIPKILHSPAYRSGRRCW